MWDLDYKERRIDAFELWCWRRLLRVPWTAGRSNQSMLMEISPEYSLEGLMLKLKLQYSDHLMQRMDSVEKTLMLGKIEGGRRRGWQRWDGWMVSLTQWTWVWVSSRSWWWAGKPGVLYSMESQRIRHNWATELNWISIMIEALREVRIEETYFDIIRPYNDSSIANIILNCEKLRAFSLKSGIKQEWSP